MEIRPIRTDKDHIDALREIERLMEFGDDTSENDKLDVLTTLVEVYEGQRWHIAAASPHDILNYAITDMGKSQSELAAILESRSLASELIKRKRRITLGNAQRISSAWHIPIQLLVAAYPEDRVIAAQKSVRAVRPKPVPVGKTKKVAYGKAPKTNKVTKRAAKSVGRRTIAKKGGRRSGSKVA